MGLPIAATHDFAYPIEMLIDILVNERVDVNQD